MTDEEKVEKMAIAFWSVNVTHLGATYGGMFEYEWENVSPLMQEYFRTYARAALVALEG